ncbi:exodeoxyribonuclease I [Allomesorhizobium camelthorni]|uniref:Exodeoxyribonuclease I n=1 Tax=Allomesorhizobium camelthorni TaxID=475069 RepID=A0A6G4WLI2_9HYPH|nr:exodeoxyribonuclease I [Mesorhizobium camelthorni]NGO55484.1 exodeoxyribonuclease I [Mesorhizobium camelthorni]
MAFIFYDTETTGADRCFDQILQFAAVLTDDELHVVDEFEIRCRPLPHIVPSPKAMLVTGVSVEQLFDSSTASHFEMCRRIQEVLGNWSPATFVGYNSLSFDEELLRRAFYSSLLPIYLTNTGGNSRLDVLTLAAAVHAFAPEAMNWPINEKGKVSFKLDRLAPANGFDHANAHDALADVHATIHLARLIRDRAPAVWHAAMSYRTKAAATEYVETQPVFVATRLRYGLHSSSLVTALGLNPDNSGELFALDLQHDPALLISMNEEQLAEYVITKPRPVSSVRLNACPVFMPMEIAGSSAAGYELGMNELLRRGAVVRHDPGLRQRLIAAVRPARLPFPESQHVEEQIYGGFYSGSDQALIETFHRVDWPRRLELASAFTDLRLRTLARRLIYFEAPEVMPADMRAGYARAIAARVHTRMETTGRWTTLDDAVEGAHRLLEEATTAEQRLLIQGHHERLTAWRDEAGVHLM